MSTKTLSATKTNNDNPNQLFYERVVKAVGLMVTGFIAYRFIKNLNEPHSISSKTKYGKFRIVSKEEAITGREWRLYYVYPKHFLTENRMFPPFPSHLQLALFGMGCFWPIEKLVCKLNGVYSTNVGYTDGFTYNPTYQEIETDKTGHNKVIRIIFDPKIISYSQLLIFFFENHNMTLSMDDHCNTYHRSAIYCYDKKQTELANKCLNEWRYLCKNNDRLRNDTIYTEIKNVPKKFYYAEDFHQSYLAKNPEKLEKYTAKGIGIKFGEEFINELNQMEKLFNEE